MKKTIIHNPVIWADIPDEDVIRNGDSYYMVSTSMHSMPGCPIMKSKDLYHWEIINYVFNTFEDNDAHNILGGKNIYGQGSWAATLRFHKGYYYVGFSCNDMQQFYLYRTDDIEMGGWVRIAVVDQLFHDPALFFDDDDTPYVIYGNGDIFIKELKKDLTGVKTDGVNKELLHTPIEGNMLRCEGGHAYKINGVYYLIYIEWPNIDHCRRRQVCYRSENLLGTYERKIILDDDMGYHNRGVAQGALIDSTAGNWYAMLFQDHDAVGRIPYVLPVTWEDGWPMIGIDGKIPEQFEVPLEEVPTRPIVISDEFNYTENSLDLNWQWNHNPDNKLWSCTQRAGYLRLTTGYITEQGVLSARNTLTQRTQGPECYGTTHIDLSGMKPGDCSGMIALQSTFGFVGVRKDENNRKRIVMCVNDGSNMEKEIESVDLYEDEIYVKIHFDFKDSIDIATCFYSHNGEEWTKIGTDVHMRYTLDHFMGYRIGLFNYATKEIGGYTDFDYFHFKVV